MGQDGDSLIVRLSQEEFAFYQSLCYQKVNVLSLFFGHNLEFANWIEARHYSHPYEQRMKTLYKKRFLGKTFATPADLLQYIHAYNRDYNNLVKCCRNYLNFCDGNTYLHHTLIENYRKILKVKNGFGDVFVPETEELVRDYKKVRGHKSLRNLTKVMAFSGTRIQEALWFLGNFKRLQRKKYGEMYVYLANRENRQKRLYIVCLPCKIADTLAPVSNTYDSLRVRFRKRKCKLTGKYYRKWFYNFLLEKGVPESVADFIQGRSPRSVSARHYLARMKQAVFWYQNVVGELLEIFG